MPNSFKVTDLLVEKTLFRFSTTNSFLSPDVSVRDYMEYFDHKKTGYFMGDSVRIRLPNLYRPSQGWTATAQGVTEREVVLALQDPINVAVSFQSNEAQNYLDIGDESYIERVAQPAGDAIIAQFNSSVSDAYKTNVYHFVGDSTADITTLNPFYQAGAMINTLCGYSNATYTYEAFGAIHPRCEATIAPELLSKFLIESNENIYRNGRLGKVNGIEIMPENTVYIHNSYTGARGTPAVKTTVASGNQIVVKGLTPSITGIIKAGDLFSLSTVKKTMPLIPGRSTLYNAQFVVKPNPIGGGDYDSSAAGECTITVNAFESSTLSPYQNITIAIPADEPLTFVGSHVANIVWLKPMLTIVAPPLAALNKGAESVTKNDPDTKVWMRYSEQDVVGTSQHTRRIDVRPGVYWHDALAVKVISKIPA
jgi:hypothetical protein